VRLVSLKLQWIDGAPILDRTRLLAQLEMLCYALTVTALLDDALRRVSALSQEEQDAIASQILETLEDEAAWKERLINTQHKLKDLAEAAKREYREGKTEPLDEIL
jgi:hypothetical protein